MELWVDKAVSLGADRPTVSAYSIDEVGKALTAHMSDQGVWCNPQLQAPLI